MHINTTAHATSSWQGKLSLYIYKSQLASARFSNTVAVVITQKQGCLYVWVCVFIASTPVIYHMNQ